MNRDVNNREEPQSFLEQFAFVPLTLGYKTETPRNKRSEESLIWIICIVSGGLAFWFFTNKTFRDYTGLNMLITICLYAILTTFVAYFLLTRFVYRIPEKVTERAVTGTANQTLALNQVWNISSGGLREEDFFRNLTGLVINYGGCPALVYRTIMGSIDGLGEGADAEHYGCSQYMLDHILNCGYTRLKVNLKYDTTNDDIWEYTADMIYNVADDMEESYINVMTDILSYQLDYTMENSRVSSSYYIIKLKHDSTISEVVNLYHTLLNASKQGSVYNMKLINLTEFRTLLQKYYGFQHIDVNRAMPKSSIKETLGDTKVIRVADSKGKGEVFKTEETKVNITGDFYDRVYTETFDMPEDIAVEFPDVDIFSD